jgi:ubiquinone/menaquinone biosynthesis C-methylase UbiE
MSEFWNPWIILFPADWEWRNWVFSSKLWWEVFCFDISEVWRNKALKLAEKNNVKINYSISDFKKLEYNENSFDCIVLTYLHFINHKEKEFTKYLDKYLKVGWTVILEWFSKKHFGRQGWPKNIDILFDLNEIKKDFSNFEILKLEEKEVKLEEGKWHNWESILVRFVWIKL